MALADILSGLATASHEHETNLLSMAHQDRQSKAKLFADLASNPNYSPEQQAWFGKAALAHATGAKEAKQFEIKDGQIKVPVEIMQPKPKPITTQGTKDTPGTDDQGQPQMVTAGINSQTIQPPTPPPTTEMRDVMQPRGDAERMQLAQIMQQMQIETEAQKAGAVSNAQLPAEVSRIRATQQAQQEFAPTPPPHYAAVNPGDTLTRDGKPIYTSPAADKPVTPTNPPPDVGEFKFYEERELAAGRKPMLYPEWVIFTANARKQATNVNMVGGLPAATQTRVQSLAAALDRNPTVNQYKEAALRSANVQQILQSTWSGPGDMAVVFEFMRALDPTSVVRESEYEAARKTGNWFKNVFARFNGLFNESGGFLSDKVKEDFNKVLQGRMAQASKQVRNMYDDYGRRIDKLTGQPGTGTDYLTDYTELLPNSPSPAPTAPNSPAPNSLPPGVKPGELARRNPKTNDVLVFRGGAWVKP